MVNEQNTVNLTINKKPVELVQELKDYEINESSLSPAARSKVIRKWGSGYVSENRDFYGPGNSNSSENFKTNLKKGVTGVVSGVGIAALTIACPPAGVATAVTIGGIGTGAKIASNFVEDSELHEDLDTVGDIYMLAGVVGGAPRGARYVKNVVTGKTIIK